MPAVATSKTREPVADETRRRRAEPWAALAGIFLLGVATRLFPLTQFAIWGSDSGEYYFLTQRLVSTGHVLFAYNGWGIAYPYFPGMFVLDGAVALVTGLDVLTVQRFTVPTLSAIVPLLTYLIAREIFPDRRVALFSAAFLAVTGPYIIIVSHPMPGTLGHVFLSASILVLLRAYRDPRWAWLLAPLGAALVLTHHLTLYFLVGAVAAIALFRELFRGQTDVRRLRIEAPYLVGLVIAAGYWWLIVASNFRDQIVGRVLDIDPWVFAALCYVVLLGIPPLLVLARRKFLPPTVTHGHWPSPRFIWISAVAVFGIVLAWVATFTFAPLPGSQSLTIAPISLLYVIPVLGVVAFALAGGRVLRLVPQGAVVSAWLIAVLASLAFSILTASKVLFSFRHVEYLMDPVAMYGAAGLFAGMDYVARLRPRLVPLASAFVLLLLLAGVAASQPPRETVAGFQEGITAAEFNGVQWAGVHLPPGSVVAADHRISSLLFGIEHRNATFDFAYETYHAETVAQAAIEMRNISIPEQPQGACVTYVFLSPVIRQGVILVQWENAAPMSAAAQAKFNDARYYAPVYGNPTDPNAVSIVKVNWPAIDQSFPPSVPGPSCGA